MENTWRENVAVLSHLDWFLAAIKSEAQMQADVSFTRDHCDTEAWNAQLEDVSAGESQQYGIHIRRSLY